MHHEFNYLSRHTCREADFCCVRWRVDDDILVFFSFFFEPCTLCHCVPDSFTHTFLVDACVIAPIPRKSAFALPLFRFNFRPILENELWLKFVHQIRRKLRFCSPLCVCAVRVYIGTHYCRSARSRLRFPVSFLALSLFKRFVFVALGKVRLEGVVLEEYSVV